MMKSVFLVSCLLAISVHTSRAGKPVGTVRNGLKSLRLVLRNSPPVRDKGHVLPVAYASLPRCPAGCVKNSRISGCFISNYR